MRKRGPTYGLTLERTTKMSKPTFKQFVESQELQESSDEQRLMRLRDATKRGFTGAQQKLEDFLATLERRKAIKGNIKQVADEYARWKESFQRRRGEHQRAQDQKFRAARAEAQTKDNPEAGSGAWRSETGSIRRGPKGSGAGGTQGTLGTNSTIGTR
jgi:hypothetical protein